MAYLDSLKLAFAAYGPLCIGLPLYALLLAVLLCGPDGEDANADPQ